MSSPTTPVEATREALRGFLGPVEAERDKHRERVAELEAELAAEREALRMVEGVISRLNGTYQKPGRKTPQTKARGPNGGTGRTFPRAEQDTAHVRGWIDANRAMLGAEFTSADVIEAMRSRGEASLGKDKVRHSMGLLHDRGYLTLVRLGSGGGKVYAITGGAEA